MSCLIKNIKSRAPSITRLLLWSESAPRFSVIKDIGPRAQFGTTLFSTIHGSSFDHLNQKLPLNNHTNLIIKRYKKKRVSKQVDQEEEEEENEEDLSDENPLLVDDILNPVSDGGEILNLDLNSLRLDSFCKSAFNYTRSKVEEIFYKGDIYVNGERPAKKSTELFRGDEVDVVKHICSEDSKLVTVNRALIIQMPNHATETGRMKIKIKRWLNLNIAPHSKSQENEEE